MDIKQIVLDLCAMNDEQEWFEFKENWFQPETLGEYVSALSNAAAFHYKKYAYFIWGVKDKHPKCRYSFSSIVTINTESSGFKSLFANFSRFCIILNHLLWR